MDTRSLGAVGVAGLAFASASVLADSTTPGIDFDVIARVGDLGIISIDRETSVNVDGEVAFIGVLDDGGGATVQHIFVGRGSTNSLVDITPGLSSGFDPILGPGVQINDSGFVITRRAEFIPSPLGDIPVSRIETWDSANPGNQSTLIYCEPLFGEFEGCLPYPSISNAGSVIFAVVDGSQNKLGTLTPEGNFIVDLNVELPHPLMADTHRFIMRLGSSRIVVLPPFIFPFAYDTLGLFSAVGKRPGIADDASILAFVGDQGTGREISFSDNSDGAGFGSPVQMTDDLTFTDVQPDSRVGISRFGGTGGAQAAFLAYDDQGTLGLYISEVSCITTPTPEVKHTLVVQVGETIPGLGGAVQDMDLYDPSSEAGQVAFWVQTSATTAVVRASIARTTVPKEGGVRARLSIPPDLTDLVFVQVFADTDRDGQLSAGETALGAPDESVNIVDTNGDGVADEWVVYFTPPSYDETIWPPLPLDGGRQSLAVEVVSTTQSLVVPAFLDYTYDVQDGVEGIQAGLTTAYREVLEVNGGLDFPMVAPRRGAVAEVLLGQVLRRAPAGAGIANSPLTNTLEQMLPQLRSFINANRPPEFALEAFVRPITAGQTTHESVEQDNSLVLTTMATGTLVAALDGSGSTESQADISGGRFFFLDDPPLPIPGVQGWNVTWHIDPMTGLHIDDLEAFRDGVPEQVAESINIPSILINGEPALDLTEASFSHLYLNLSVTEGIPHDLSEELVLAAMYRVNLDRSETYPDTLPQNEAREALVVRQSYAFSAPYEEFEPTKCLIAGQVYPRASFSISDPEGDGAAPSSVRVDHRVALNPQEEVDAKYVAGFFRDVDDVNWWMSFPEGFGLSCQPYPFWANIFECSENSIIPVQNAMIVDTDDADTTYPTPDNIHLHKVHDDVYGAGWIRGDFIVEAPGSFNGTIHCHWRWGAEYSQVNDDDFGDGLPVFPDGQQWIIALAPSAAIGEDVDDFVDAIQGQDVLTGRKTLLVGCRVDDPLLSVQYETFSTGFAYGLGPATGIICPTANALTKLGGYAVLSFGWCNPTQFEELAIVMAEAGSSLVLPWKLKVLLLAVSLLCDPAVDGLEGPQTDLCDLTVLVEEDLGQPTPLSITMEGGNMVTFASVPPSNFTVSPGVMISSLGYNVAENVGAAGSTLTIDFAAPVRQVRNFAVSVREEAFPPDVSIQVLSGGVVLDTLTVSPQDQGALFPEVAINIDPGQQFDQLMVASTNPAVEFAVGQFGVCDETIIAADLDYDGDVDGDDVAAFAFCFGGPDEPVTPWCTDADLDGDGDVDCDDWIAFEANWTGPPIDPPSFGPCAVPCPGDVDGSGAVDFPDLLAVLAAWGPCAACPQDLDGNLVVDFQDLLQVLSAWGGCP